MNRITRWLLSLPVRRRTIHPVRKTDPAKPAVEHLEDRTVPSRPVPYPVIYVGAGPGSEPVVKAYNAETGSVNFEADVFEADFTGGVQVATADLTGDGFPDLIAAPGAGGGPRVRILDGKSGE